MIEVKVPDGVGAIRGLEADIEIYQQFLAFLGRTFKLIARFDYDLSLRRSKCNSNLIRIGAIIFFRYCLFFLLFNS
jgi:hypothetical protein